MNSHEIYPVVHQHFMNHEHIFKNKYIFDWESDFFCVSSSGYCIEVEVKVSKADFKKDFEKRKHEHIKRFLAGQRYIVHPGDTGTCIARGMNDVRLMPVIRTEICGVDIIDLHALRKPNKFWYAVPHGLIDKKDVPPYAGLMYIEDQSKSLIPKHGYRLTVVKSAPFIHKELLDVKSILFDKYYWQAQAHEREIRERERLLDRYIAYMERKGIKKSDIY